MAGLQGIDDKRQISEWLESSKMFAQQLLIKTGDISEKLFKSGDISVFFSLLSRFSYLDYRNILLIAAQYPKATDIAGASVWKSMVSKGSLFLKEEFQGKGISLLAPFTETGKSDSKLIWFTIKMYDISQTKVIKKETAKAFYLKNKKEHIDILLKSIRSFISDEYYISYVVTKTDEHVKTGLPCVLKNKLVYIRPKADELMQISFFTEYIVKSEIDEPLPKEIIVYLASSVRDSLFDIWNLPKQISCSPPYESITDMATEKQEIFLNKAQQLVRYIEDRVLSEYRMLAKDRDINYDDII